MDGILYTMCHSTTDNKFIVVCIVEAAFPFDLCDAFTHINQHRIHIMRRTDGRKILCERREKKNAIITYLLNTICKLLKWHPNKKRIDEQKYVCDARNGKSAEERN